MSNITMSADWHFGKSNGKFDNIILEGIRAQCNHGRDNNIKTLLHLGDLLDIKQTISTTTLNKIAEACELLNETFDKVFLIVGNHDMSKKTYDHTGHNLHIFKGYPNIEVVDEPKIFEISNKQFYLLPYFPNELIKSHKFPKADYMFCHN